MRGEHVKVLPRHATPDGIIPACAGSTRITTMPPTLEAGSSPHARGALLRRSLRRHILRDSSPHARGALSTSRTPTRQGSSPHARGAPPGAASETQARWDHPRMRGEHEVAHGPRGVVVGIIPACAGSTMPWAAPSFVSRGSSPHARGALRMPHRRRAEAGIIPACAGSTSVMPPVTGR